MQTRQTVEDNITDRKEYLHTIELQIEEVTNLGNNRLFELNCNINKAEQELASVLNKKYELEQIIRELQNVVDNM
jgi:prefoldin subunit 5